MTNFFNIFKQNKAASEKMTSRNIKCGHIFENNGFVETCHLKSGARIAQTDWSAARDMLIRYSKV